MPKCPVCDCEDFDLQDGLYYCTECCTQSQVIREERLEEDYVDGVRNVRKIGSSKKERKRTKKNPGYQWRTVQAYNIIIHEQAKALVALGAGPEFKMGVLQMWSRYLNLCEHAFVKYRKNWTPRLCTRPYVRDVQLAMGAVVRYRRLVARGPNRVGLVRKFHNYSRRSAMKKRRMDSENPSVKEEKTKKKKRAASDLISSGERSNATADNAAPEIKKKKKKKKEETTDPDLMEGREESGAAKDDAEAAAEPEKIKKPQNVLKYNYKFSQLALKTFKRKGSKVKTLTSSTCWYVDRTEMLTIISIVCLVLRMTCPSILLSDVSRWIQQGHIPYMKAYRLLPPDWKIFTYERSFFSSRVVPTVPILWARMVTLANFMHITRSPVVDVQYAAARYLADMNLPHELMAFVNVVIQRFMQKGPKTMCRKIEQDAGISILFVLKHLFGLDSQTEKTLSALTRNANLERENEGVEKFFIWSDWQEQMEEVLTYIRTHNPYSINFSPRECQDVDTLVSYIQFHVPALREGDAFAQYCDKKIAENLESIKRSLSRLTREGRPREPNPLEPAGSFPIQTVLEKCMSRNRREFTDFSKQKIHPGRSKLYWFCHDVGLSSDAYSRRFPDSFLVAFYVLQEITHWQFKHVISDLKYLEETVFAMKPRILYK